jgi:hypothetical protein
MRISMSYVILGGAGASTREMAPAVAVADKISLRFLRVFAAIGSPFSSHPLFIS